MTTDRAGEGREAVDRFFERELLPLARELRAAGARLLETSREPGGSYYRARQSPAMARAAFEWGGAESPEQLEADLRRLWRDPDGEALARLAPGVARLATLLRRGEEQTGEVSQFVYVMY